MKRLIIALVVSTFFVSCLNDDDDFIAVCETPTEITASNITDTSISLSWINNNELSEVSIEFGPSGFQAGSGTTVTTTDNSITIENLSPNTVYDYYISAICSANNSSMVSEVNSITTDVSPVVAQFLPTLSQLNLFVGELKDLNLSPKVFKYELNTQLFTDYAHKLRIIGLPAGASLEYQDDGFPIFPTGTLITKTFYYNLDETISNSEKQIIETRVLIKEANEWTIGNYVWNEEQTEAFLDTNTHDVKVDYKNANGDLVSIDYVIPSDTDCRTCHSNSGNVTPIGPKLRTMNFDVDGINQLQKFIDEGHLTNAPTPTSIAALPNWEDVSNHTLEERARAYFDVNCAHCHEPGGFCEDQSTLNLKYETPFNDTNIFERRFSISNRMATYSPGTSMPFIGTTIIHTEGYSLIQEYLDSLE